MDRIDSPKVWTNEELDVPRISIDWRLDPRAEGGGLPTLIDRITGQVMHGPGVLLARGAMKGVDQQEAARVLVQLGESLGNLMTQDGSGGLVYEVSNNSNTLESRAPLAHSRGAQNNHGIGLHTENDGEPSPPQVVMFCCLKQADEGGDSLVGSGLYAHNLLYDQSRSALERLYEPIKFALRPEHYGDGVVSDAVFTEQAAGVRMRYSRYWINRAAFIEGRQLSSQTVDALDTLDNALADPRIRIHFRLEQGDLLVLDNRSIMHGRTGFNDTIIPGEGRTLLRLWVDALSSGSATNLSQTTHS